MMVRNNSIVTYEPDNSLKKGYWQLFAEIFSEIKSSRWLTYQLFRRNFFAMYKQSFIGFLWIIILPIIHVSVFTMLNDSGVFNLGEMEVPYPVFAISGIALWQVFATGLVACGSSLTSAGTMVTRINFSKKSLVFAPMGKTIISFFVQIILVLVLCLMYSTKPSWGMLFLPIVVVPILLFTVGCGFIIAILNALVRDVGNMLSLGITFLMYLTPVLYAKPRIGILAHATQYNPMYYFVSAGRDLILNGQILEITGFVWSTILSIFLFIAALLVFHLTETRIAERV